MCFAKQSELELEVHLPTDVVICAFIHFHAPVVGCT